MDPKFIYGFFATLLLAIVGYFATYWNGLVSVRRKDRLDRINQQLKLLYGPLLALSHACDAAAEAFRSEYRHTVIDFHSTNPLNEEGLVAWRRWMTEVLMPLNLRIERVLIENADLLVEDEMPDCILTLVAHIEAYKAVLKQWEAGDFSRHTSLVKHPGREILVYAERSFKTLKVEQARVIGALRR